MTAIITVRDRGREECAVCVECALLCIAHPRLLSAVRNLAADFRIFNAMAANHIVIERHALKTDHPIMQIAPGNVCHHNECRK